MKVNRLTHTVIDNTYNKEPIRGYWIKFGNAYWGYKVLEPEFLPLIWLMAIRLSQGQRPGDVALMYNDEIVRGLSNGHVRILDKFTQYPLIINKYNDGTERIR